MEVPQAESLQIRAWVPAQLHEQISLGLVQGGQVTSSYWGSKISDEALRQALEDSLRDAGMLARTPQGGRYEMRAQLSQLKQPMVALNVKVELVMVYTVVERKTGATRYQRELRVPYTVDWTEALLDQNERMRMANEAALRKSISTMMRELVELHWD